MAFDDGPYVQAACFCDMVLQEKTGVLSLIRIVDVVESTASGPNPPDDMPPTSYRFKLVLMLKSGNARGRYNVTVVPQLPTGETKDPFIASTYFEGEEKGHNIVVDMAFVFDVEGLYWFKVYIDDNKLTAIPFRAKYNRIVTTAARPLS